MMLKLINRLRRPPEVKAKMQEIDRCISAGLPRQMRPALEYLVSGVSDSRTPAVVKAAETRRGEIAQMGDKAISIWGSPKPGSGGHDSSIDARPQPGRALQFTMGRIARTGKNQKWGTVLYLIARAFKSSVVIELGTCAGISAIYFSSVPTVTTLITVEGSVELANIARQSLETCRNAHVVNALFDEALDSQLPSLESKVDLAFVDGHHEKVATIHYFERLIPLLRSRAVVIFDDVSWSSDMREAWNILSKRSEFAHCVDLGEIGVCVAKTKGDSHDTQPKYWDLQPVVGRHSVSEGPDFWTWDT
jgi:predicted O-methyltransferase YrrM